MIGAVAAVGTAIAFAYVEHLRIESVAYGLLAGTPSGLGPHLILTDVLTTEWEANATDGEGTAGAPQSSGGLHTGGAGVALDMCSLSILAWGFVSDVLLDGPLVAVGVVSVAYVVVQLFARQDA